MSDIVFLILGCSTLLMLVLYARALLLGVPRDRPRILTQLVL
ncbi:hypothetical protein [Ciceribacter azotifigens]